MLYAIQCYLLYRFAQNSYFDDSSVWCKPINTKAKNVFCDVFCPMNQYGWNGFWCNQQTWTWINQEKNDQTNKQTNLGIFGMRKKISFQLFCSVNDVHTELEIQRFQMHQLLNIPFNSYIHYPVNDIYSNITLDLYLRCMMSSAI